jgi:hypothetical protein
MKSNHLPTSGSVGLPSGSTTEVTSLRRMIGEIEGSSPPSLLGPDVTFEEVAGGCPPPHTALTS